MNKKQKKTGGENSFGSGRGAVDVPGRLAFMNRSCLHAVLATVSEDGPYTSLVSFALTPDSRALIFATPRATVKYRNILKDSRVSLLIDTRTNSKSDYGAAEAVTIAGTAKPVRKGARWMAFGNVLVRKHPALRDFVNAPGTALVAVRISRCVHVGRFQIVSVWEARD